MPDEVALVAGLPHKRTALGLGMLVPEQFGDRLFLKLGLIGALVLEFELMFGGCLAIGGVSETRIKSRRVCTPLGKRN